MSALAAASALPPAAARFAERLRLGADEGEPGRVLHDRGALAATIASARAARPGADPRAIASILGKSACAAALPGPLAAAACGVALDVGPDAARIVRDAAGRPLALALPLLRPLDEADFAARLFGDLLAPHFSALSDVAGVSPRVLWANAGNVAAWTLGTLLQDEPPPPRAGALYRALFHAMRVPWSAGPNPLRRPVVWRERIAPGSTPLVHRRRVCCLRDRAGETRCWSCPCAPAEPRG